MEGYADGPYEKSWIRGFHEGCQERCLRYDRDDRLIKLDNGFGSSLEFTYNERGKLSAVMDHSGRKLKCAYQGKQLSSVCLEGKPVYYESHRRNREQLLL